MRSQRVYLEISGAPVGHSSWKHNDGSICALAILVYRTDRRHSRSKPGFRVFCEESRTTRGLVVRCPHATGMREYICKPKLHKNTYWSSFYDHNTLNSDSRLVSHIVSCLD